MEPASLNKKHEQMLQKYVNFVKGSVFEATDDYKTNKFVDFNEILNNIIGYTNSFNRIVETTNRRNEWAYMTPNLMLYATMGFLAGIKKKSNENMIEKLSEGVFEKTVEFIGETTDILQDITTKELIQKKILTFNKKNEHND